MFPSLTCVSHFPAQQLKQAENDAKHKEDKRLKKREERLQRKAKASFQHAELVKRGMKLLESGVQPTTTKFPASMAVAVARSLRPQAKVKTKKQAVSIIEKDLSTLRHDDDDSISGGDYNEEPDLEEYGEEDESGGSNVESVEGVGT